MVNMPISDQQLSKEKKAKEVYTLISNTANQNTVIQGLGGILGTFTSVGADIYALKIYYGLWNSIREMYGYPEITSADVETIVTKIGKELVYDIAFDKVIGYIPLIGIATNIMCAKTLTWRLGILFGMLSARGSEVPDDSVNECVKLIRHIYPQNDMFTFKTPEEESVIQLITNVHGNTLVQFHKKVTMALEVMEDECVS